MSRQTYTVVRVCAFHVATGIIALTISGSLGWATQVNAMSGQAPQVVQLDEQKIKALSPK